MNSNMNLYMFAFLIWCNLQSGGETRTIVGQHIIDGYYWRDYSGVIPRNAVPGGKDELGEITYIGQALHSGLLTPGQISRDNNSVVYEFGNKEYAEDSDIKILCSQYPERLTWVKVRKNGEFDDLNGSNLIIGGYDKQGPLAVGRIIRENGEVAVGKVLVINEKFGLLYTTENQKGRQDTSYEVLVYNYKEPNKPTEPSVCCPQKVINVHFH